MKRHLRVRHNVRESDITISSSEQTEQQQVVSTSELSTSEPMTSEPMTSVPDSNVIVMSEDSRIEDITVKLSINH